MTEFVRIQGFVRVVRGGVALAMVAAMASRVLSRIRSRYRSHANC
jgi:hypothetical protein